MNLDLVKEHLQSFLEENNLYLYDLSYKRIEGNLTLQVLIDSNEGLISVDSLEACNNYLSEFLDTIDEDEGDYYLEVSSPGAERELRNETDVLKSVGKYIHLEKDGMKYEGTLLNFNDNVLTLKVNLKGRFKNFEFNYQELRNVRLAVKI